MDASFWHERWKKNQIGFHESKPNPLLVKHWAALSAENGNRVFLPLCGKSLDVAWLLGQGYRVVGAELSETAIQQLFDELGVQPTISQVGNLKHYQADSVDIYVGDIFDLSREQLGPVDVVYDRAALVALPEDTRVRYVKHLVETTNAASQILICFEYDQNLIDGPPFSISDTMVKNYYEERFQITLLEDVTVPGGLKGLDTARETVWVLKEGEAPV